MSALRYTVRDLDRDRHPDLRVERTEYYGHRQRGSTEMPCGEAGHDQWPARLIVPRDVRELRGIDAIAAISGREQGAGSCDGGRWIEEWMYDADEDRWIEVESEPQ